MKIWSIVGAVAVLIALLVALGVWHYREDPRLAEIRRLQAELQKQMAASRDATPDGAAPNGAALSDEERHKLFGELREKIDALPEAERQQIRNAGRSAFMKAMQDRLKAFFAMSADERKAYLDNLIEQAEERQKERAASNANNPNQGQWQHNRPAQSDAQREAHQRNRINSTTPEFRAQTAEFIREVNQRTEQLGLPPISPRAFFGRGGPLRPPQSAPPTTVAAPVPAA